MSQRNSGKTRVLKALVIPQTVHEPLQVQSILGDPDAALQKMVGGPLQSLDLTVLSAVLVVNQGRCDPAPPESLNVRATLMERVSEPSTPVRGGIGGPAVLLGPQEGGTFTSIPDQLVDELIHGDRFRVQLAHRSRPNEWTTTPGIHEDWFTGALAAVMACRSAGPDWMGRFVPEVSPLVRRRWAAIANDYLARLGADRLRPEHIESHYQPAELSAAISRSPLKVGTAMIFSDVCLVNLAEDAGKWLVINKDRAYEVTPLWPVGDAQQPDSVVGLLISAEIWNEK